MLGDDFDAPVFAVKDFLACTLKFCSDYSAAHGEAGNIKPG